MGLLDSILMAAKDSYDQASGDVGRLMSGDMSAALDIYDQLTRGPAPQGKLLQALGAGFKPVMAHVPGTYRALGLERAGGSMNPAQYIANLQAQPNYQRFLQLVQGMVRKSPELGKEFPVFRGKELNDPLMKALATGAENLPVTAVSTNPNVALDFARGTAATTRKPAALMAGRATPESVVGLLPTRNTNARAESELLLNPNLMAQRPQIVGNVNTSGGMPYFNTPRTPYGGGEKIDDIIKALNEAASVSPTEELQRALAIASQPVR